MADTGRCDIALFGGPYVIVDTSTTDLGTCDIALFGGPPIAYVVATTQTQEETMSGGAIAGGVGSGVALRVEESSAGAVAAGAVTKETSSTHEEVGAGGSVAAGSVTTAYEVVYAADEGAVAAGTASKALTIALAASGGAVASNTLNPLALLAEVSGAGGVVAGGTSPIVAVRGHAAVGGGVAADSSALECVMVLEGSSGGVSSGTGNEWLHYALHVVEADGGVVAAGSAQSLCAASVSATGGAIASGSANQAFAFAYEGTSGGIAQGIGDFEWADNLPDDEQPPCDNIRQIIRAAATGLSFRIRLAGSKVAPVTITGASFGERSGSTANFTDLPVRLTFGGSDSVTIPADGTVYSDWVILPVVKNSYYLFHMTLDDANSWMKVKPVGVVAEYYKLSGTDDTMVQTVSGYSTSSNKTAVISVEITASLLVSYTGIEGAVVGDSSEVAYERSYTVGGGALAGGTASVTTFKETLLQTTVGLGGAVAGDSADVVKMPAVVSTQGVVAGGSATLYITYTNTSDGGAVSGGTYVSLQSGAHEGLGGSVAGGEVVVDISGSGALLAKGGAIIGGTASLLQITARLGDGGCVVGYTSALGLYHATNKVVGSQGYWEINATSNPVWAFTEQKNKWGYLNNPRWTDAPAAPVSYDGREDEEPQVWETE